MLKIRTIATRMAYLALPVAYLILEAAPRLRF